MFRHLCAARVSRCMSSQSRPNRPSPHSSRRSTAEASYLELESRIPAGYRYTRRYISHLKEPLKSKTLTRADIRNSMCHEVIQYWSAEYPMQLGEIELELEQRIDAMLDELYNAVGAAIYMHSFQYRLANHIIQYLLNEQNGFNPNSKMTSKEFLIQQMKDAERVELQMMKRTVAPFDLSRQINAPFYFSSASAISDRQMFELQRSFEQNQLDDITNDSTGLFTPEAITSLRKRQLTVDRVACKQLISKLAQLMAPSLDDEIKALKALVSCVKMDVC